MTARSKTITFTFNTRLSPKAQEKLLEVLGDLPGILRATRVRPGAKLKALLRLGIVELSPDANANSVLEFLQTHPGIESCSLAPMRRLIR